MVALGARGIRVSASVAVSVLLVASLGTAALGYVTADRVVHPAREHKPWTPAQRGLAFEEASFVTADGLRLSAWWVPASGESAGTVVFLHGYGASKSQALAVVPFLHRAGYSVLTFDFRAHGESEGAFTTVGLDEAEDVRAAVRYLRERGDVDMGRVALFGWSMGAAAALLAARDLPEVRAVVADSSFASLHNVVANNLEHFTGLPPFPFSPVVVAFGQWMTGHDPDDNVPAREAARLQRPLLVIQGGQDAIARPEGDGLRIAAAAGEWGEYWLVPEAGHVDARRAAPREYEARVLAFLTAALAGDGPETLK